MSSMRPTALAASRSAPRKASAEPFSIASTQSAMRSTSRAALASATEGVRSATSSR